MNSSWDPHPVTFHINSCGPQLIVCITNSGELCCDLWLPGSDDHSWRVITAVYPNNKIVGQLAKIFGGITLSGLITDSDAKQPLTHTGGTQIWRSSNLTQNLFYIIVTIIFTNVAICIFLTKDLFSFRPRYMLPECYEVLHCDCESVLLGWQYSEGNFQQLIYHDLYADSLSWFITEFLNLCPFF